MRRRGLVAVPVLLASLALGAPAAHAADALKMYRTTVDEESVGVLGELGVDLGHTGYTRLARPGADDLRRPDRRAGARGARRRASALEEVTPGPHVTETQIEQAARRGRDRRSAQALAKPETGGDSPNPFYDVFRSYSEPGGIKDEMTALAAAQPRAWPSSS